MRILVCGGRNFGHVARTKPRGAETPLVQARLEEYNYIQDELSKLTTKFSLNYNPNDNWLPTDITIIAGGATGVDSVAADFAVVNYCQLEKYPADWNKYGKRAGYIRNKQMLDEGRPDLVVAFPGGKGTDMMVDMATKAGIKVIKMGILGFGIDGSTYCEDRAEKLKTERFIKIYFQRIAELKEVATTNLKKSIFREVVKQEREWLANMGSEYDEIMQAQEIIERANGN